LKKETAMNTPHSSSPRWSLHALGALIAIAAMLAAAAGTARAYVSPAQAEHAAERGANWFQANQEESGNLGADWAMTALAAADLNAADVSTSLLAPSAQDYYLGEWQATGPGGAATDAERGVLTGIPGGIQPSRLSADPEATKSNLVARIAELFDGTQIGAPGLLNDDIFGVLALHQAGAPQVLLRRIADYLRGKQLADGGWTWNSAPDAIADTDMTGSVLAAFCAAAVEPGDPDLDRALALLHSLQDPATGGFIAPPEAFGIGVNSDTTSWVVSGLIECGIDPQGPEWTTDQGKTPLDYLVSLQRPDGHFDWTDEFAGGAFETYSAVRPLGGVGFSSPPPARLDGVSPAVRPAATVADGTAVPVTLVIDHGPGADDVRMCRVDLATGAGLGELLTAAAAASAPADCVSEFALDGAGAEARLASLDGVAETADYEWQAGIDGSTPGPRLARPVGFGDLVFLRFAPKPGKTTATSPPPAVEVPAVGPGPRAHARRPRVGVRNRARWRHGKLWVRLRCPRGNGALGCRGVLAVRYRSSRQRLRWGGSRPFRLRSASARWLRMPATRGLRRAARRRRVKLRIVAATRAEDGSLRLTHVHRFVSR
jgi:hypothetical protein